MLTKHWEISTCKKSGLWKDITHIRHGLKVHHHRVASARWNNSNRQLSLVLACHHAIDDFVGGAVATDHHQPVVRSEIKRRRKLVPMSLVRRQVVLHVDFGSREAWQYLGICSKKIKNWAMSSTITSHGYCRLDMLVYFKHVRVLPTTDDVQSTLRVPKSICTHLRVHNLSCCLLPRDRVGNQNDLVHS